MSLSATLFGRDSAIFKATNILGLGIPGWLDKKFGPAETEGPRLSDLSVQTSTYGADIPRVYGTISVMGNVIWMENNRLKETVRKNKSGGKGGAGASEPTKTYSYSATFILALCEGEITGIRRIWCADRLIYNAGSDDIETLIASNKAASGFRIYKGSDDQMPDSRYEADVGVGNASAFRGTAYIAFYDFKLADYSNTLQASQFKVEVVKSGSQDDGGWVVRKTSASNYLGAAFSDARLISVGTIPGIGGNSVSTSSNRVDWLDHPFTNPSTDGLYDVTSYGGVWAAVGHYGAFLSINGAAWTAIPLSTSYRCITATDDGLIAGGFAGAIAVSGDGVSWEEQVIGSSTINGIGHQGLVVIAVGDAGAIYRSENGGSSWAALTSPTAATLKDVKHNGDLWVALGNGAVINSVDGITWSLAASAPARSFSGLAWGGSEWVASSEDLDRKLTRSADGDTWIDDEVQCPGIPADANAFGIIHTGIDYVLFGEGFISTQRTAEIVSPLQESLSEILEAEVMQSNLIDSSDIDVSMISRSVIGYRASTGSIRSAIDPLQSAFQFDVVQSGYKIKFVPRGQSSILDVSDAEIVMSGGDSSAGIIKIAREMDTQLPAKTTVKYLDAAREYSISEQYHDRINTEAVNSRELELPIVMTADGAAKVAEVLQGLPWLERSDFSFTLPPSYQVLQPSDVVTLVTADAQHELRITEINYAADGQIECMAKPERASLYTSSASGSEGVPPSGGIGVEGQSLFIPLDIPVVDESIQNAVGFVGVMSGFSEGWPGAILVRSADGGQTWTDIQGYVGKASIATAFGTLPSSQGHLIDQRTLRIAPLSGSFESVSHDQMLLGTNYAAYGVNGRWEIVRFQNADLQADGTYIISGFVRGERGTEWSTGLHAAGDFFILLDDPDNAFIGMTAGSISAESLYRPVTSGSTVDDAIDVNFTYRGVNLECLSPVYAKGSRDGSSNFTGTFTRRSRLSGSWWANGIQSPVGESSESYEVDVMSGSTVKRTIAVTSPSFTYSAANQTTDFGSAQSSITFRIYQLSELVGRGYPLEVTL